MSPEEYSQLLDGLILIFLFALAFCYMGYWICDLQEKVEEYEDEEDDE